MARSTKRMTQPNDDSNFSPALLLESHSAELDIKEEIYNPMVKFDDFTFSRLLEQYNEKCKKYLQFIYFYRSITKPISNIDHNRGKKFSKAVFKIVLPLVKKIAEIKDFVEKVSSFLCQNIIERFQNTKYISKHLYTKLLALLDNYMRLNFVLNYKTALVNDFSFFKRERAISRITENSEELEEKIQKGQTLFSDVNFISKLLRNKIQERDSYTKVLLNLISHMFQFNTSNYFYDNNDSLTFNRCIFYISFLLDGKDFVIFKSKKNLVEKMKDIMQTNNVFPIYNDCNIVAKYFFMIFYNKNHPRANDWIFEQNLNEKRIKSLLESTKEIINEYLMEIIPLRVELKSVKTQPNDDDILTWHEQKFDTIIKGLKFVSYIKITLEIFNSFKLENFLSEEEYETIKQREKEAEQADDLLDEKVKKEAQGLLKGDFSAFERRMLYNYSKEDLFMILDLLSKLKKICQIFIDYEIEILEIINAYLYMRLQKFLREEVLYASKYKTLGDSLLKDFREILMTYADFEFENSKVRSSKSRIIRYLSRKDKTKLQETSVNEKKNVIFGDNEILEISIFIEKTIRASKNKDINLNKKSLEDWIDIDEKVYNFYKVKNLKNLVMSISETSFFWYKEANLSLTGCITFPIELSLPGILTEFILKNTSISKSIFSVLGIYNDSARLALRKYKKQHIYEEVEAECSFLLDKFLFQFSQKVVEEAQNSAAFLFLPSTINIRNEMNHRDNFERLIEVASCSQFNLLGRKISFRKMVSALVNRNLREILDYTITKFEALGIQNTIEFEFSLKVFIETLCLLKEHLEVDSFEQIFSEVNECTGITSFNGRVLNAANFSMLSDIIPNFTFNTVSNYFTRVKEPVSMREKAKKFYHHEISLGTAYHRYLKVITRSYTKYVGNMHFSTLIKILKKTELVLLMNEVINFGEEVLVKRLHPYFKRIIKAIPIIKRPNAIFGYLGAHTTYDLKLKPIDDYPPLRTHVLQALKEYGNTLALVTLIDVVRESLEVTNSIYTDYFLGEDYSNILKDYEDIIKNKIDSESGKNRNLETLSKAMKAHGESFKEEDEEYYKSCLSVAENSELYKKLTEKESEESYLSGALLRYTKKIYRTDFVKDFNGLIYSNPVLGFVSSGDITQIATSLKFIVCNSKKDEKVTDDLETFGDSIIWALSQIVFSMDQLNRYESNDYCRYLVRLNEREKHQKDENKSPIKKTFNMTAFIALEEHYNSIFKITTCLFKNHYKPPSRYIKTKDLEGKNKWIVDDFEQKKPEKLMGSKN